MTIALGTISAGTLRAQDLVPAFEAALRIYHPAAYTQLLTLPFDRVPGDARGDSQHEFWGTEAADDYVAELISALDEACDPGVYFGAHPGDGADFGFWCVEENQ